MFSAETCHVAPPDIPQLNKCFAIIDTMADFHQWTKLAGLRRAMICQLISLHGLFFTGHRCICSLPSRYPEFPRETIFLTGTLNRRRKIQLRPIYLALGDLNTQPLPGLHSFSGADITGTVA